MSIFAWPERRALPEIRPEKFWRTTGWDNLRRAAARHVPATST
ncbi:hypothetical protein [Corynebacterium renale]|nr:hypothetical protein [Corynebacterium renale]